MKKIFTIFICFFLLYSIANAQTCAVTIPVKINTCGPSASNGQMQVDFGSMQTGPFTISWNGGSVATTGSKTNFVPTNANSFSYWITGLSAATYTITVTSTGATPCTSTFTNQVLTNMTFPGAWTGGVYNSTNNWNVYVFQGTSSTTSVANLSTNGTVLLGGSWRGLYTSLSKPINAFPGCSAPTNCAASFEFNLAGDGWDAFKSPKFNNLAAATGYTGCDVPFDNFGFIAKRKGFPCGYYYIKKVFVDNDMQMSIKQDGGTLSSNGPTTTIPLYTFDPFKVPADPDVWQGYLGPNSTIDISGYDVDFDTKFQLDFYRDDAGKPGIAVASIPAICSGSAPVVGLTPLVNPTGGTMTSVAPSPLPSPTHAWTGAGLSFSSTTTINPTITNASTAAINATYTATDHTGCTSSKPVSVNPAPDITITNGITNVCKSATSISIPFTLKYGTSANYTVTLSNPLLTAVLPLANSNLITSPFVFTTGGLVPAGSYTIGVVIKDKVTGCSSVAKNFVINIIDAAVTILPNAPVINCGVGVMVTASGSSTPAVTPALTYTYLWTGATTGATKTLTAAGTYTVTVTSSTPGCTAIASVIATATSTAPVATITPATTVVGCNQITFAPTYLPVTPTATAWAWSTNGTGATNGPTYTTNGPGTYTVTVTYGASGCTSTSSVTFTGDSNVPTLSFSPTATEITCTTPSVTVTAVGASATTGATFTYSWSAPVSSTGATKLFNTTGTGATQILYDRSITVTVTANNGCTAVNTVIVKDNTVPSAGIAPAFNKICPGSTTMTLFGTGGENKTDDLVGTYLWNTGATTKDIVATAGAYQVTVTNPGNGCTGVAAVTISANSYDFTATGSSICKGATATLATAITSGTPQPVTGFAVVEKMIPSNSTTGKFSKITISGAPVGSKITSAATSIRLNMSIGASYAGDIDAFLIGPGNCGNMPIVASNLGAGNSYINTTFSTVTGGSAIGVATAPANSSGGTIFTPVPGANAQLTAPATQIGASTAAPTKSTAYSVLGTTIIPNVSLNNCPINGDWELRVFHDYTPDVAKFNNWSLEITPSPAVFTHQYALATGSSGTIGTVTTSGGTTLPNGTANVTALTTPGIFNYDLSVLSGNCTLTKQVPIKVFDIPTVTATTTCATTSTSLDGSITAVGVINNANHTGTDIGVVEYALSATGPWVTGTFTGLAAGAYTVYVRNSAKTTCTATLAVTVNFIPTATASALNPNLGCVLTSTTLTAGGGSTGATYAWSNTLGSAATTGLVTPTATTTYTVTVTNPGGCSATQTVIVNVDKTQPTVTATAINPSLDCTTTTTTLTATGGGTYLWSNTLGTAATTAAVTPTATTTYNVTVTGSNGCSATQSVTVTVNKALPSVTASAATPNLDCTTTSTTLTATGGGTYAWSNTLGTNATTAAVSPTTTSSYVVTVTAPNGCTNSQSVTVNVNNTAPISTISAVNTNLTCTTTSTTLSVTGGGTYAWSDGLGSAATTAAVSPTATKTYTVTVTGSNNCTVVKTITINVNNTAPTVTATASNPNLSCSTTTTTLTATGGGTYLWSNSLGTNATTATISPTATTPYTVTVTAANGCTSTQSVTVNVDTTIPTATIAASFPTIDCTNPSTTLTATGGTYLWSNGLGTNATTSAVNPISNTTYSVTVTATNGCTIIKTINVTVNKALPTVTASATTPNLDCSTTATTLTATGGGTYAWSNTLGTNATTAAVTPTSNTTYTVTITAANGCTNTQSVTVNVNNTVPTSTATASNPNLTCTTTSTTLTATGGGTYLWSDGLGTAATTAAVSPTATKTYSVTVTGTNGCTIVKTITVNVNNTLPTVTVNAVTPNLTCTTTSTTLSATGGGTYAWSNSLGSAATTSAVTPSTNTTYTVTVTTPANGCTATGTINIMVDTNIPVVTAVANNTNVNCGNPSTTLTASGGNTYLWSNTLGTNATTSAVTPVSNTTYSVTITATNGCSVIKTVIVNVDSSVPTATATAASPTINCTTTSTVLTATGGTSYNWSDALGTNATTAAVNPTATKTYTVTVTGANGCTSTKTVTVTVDTAQPTSTVSAVNSNLTCTTPSTTLSATGGGTYAWSDGLGTSATTAAVSPTATKTYSVTVTGTNGCTIIKNIIINVNNTLPTPTATAANPNLDCTTTTTTLTASGGVSYNWSNSLGTNATTAAVNPSSNTTYTVTATAANGCTATATVSVNVNTNIPVSTITQNTPTINCSTPSTTLTATGGATYSWDNSLGTNATTSAVSPIINTTYSVTVTAANGCSSVKMITVNVDLVAPTATATATTPTINCTTTSTILTASGGTTYNWSDALGTNAVTAAVNPTATKTYTVTVTGSNGCTSTKTVTVTVDTTQPISTVSAVNSNLNCTTPSTTLTATGGGTYAWSDGLGTSATTAAVSPTATKNYSVTVTGANGCTIIKTITINVNNTLPTPAATAANPNLDCTTTTTTLTASGGVTYNWSNGLGTNATTIAVNPTANTTYTVTATAANGCTATATVSVNVNTNIPVSTITQNTPTINCTTPSTTLTAAGGNTYAWDNSLGTNATTATITPLANTTYTVTVTATNGCTSVKSITVNVDLVAPTATATATTPTINCTTTSTVLTATGGTSYNWSDALGTNATTAAVNPTATKTYTVTVTGANGCTSTKTVTVTVDTAQPTSTVSAVNSNLNCTTPSTTLSVTGGASYAWSDGLGTSATTAAVSPTATKTYSVTVTGANGCTIIKTITINVNNTLPTPSATAANPNLDCNTTATTLTAIGGVSYNWSNTLGTNPTTAAVSPTANTTYTVTATAANGCTATATVSVNVNTVLPISTISAVNPALNCTTPSTTLSITGGGTYSWDNSLGTAATTASVSPTINTTYSVTITGSNGCSVIKTLTINVDKTAPTATISAVSPALNCTTPSTTLTAGGGTTYSWDNSLGTNATTATITPLANTTYSVTVTAANGCTSTKSINITVDKTAPTATISAVNTALNCTTPSTTLTATGGGTYAWDNSLGTNATTASITPSANTTYSVTVTTANGCTAVKSINITVDISAPTATISAANPALNCTTPSTTLTAGGGATYAWDNSLGTNATTATILPLLTTTYSVTVTAANGCTAVKTLTINVDKTAPTATISAVSTALNCTTPSTTLTAGGGTTYSWDNSLGTNATTATITPTANTTYSVTVTAANGCTSTKSIDITVDKTAPTATISAVSTALNCTTPSTTLTAGGGTTYSWDNSLGTNATTATITPTANTTYSVTVTAANGCTAVKSIDITVDKTAPTATISAVSTALNCTTPSTTLTAGGGTTYSWDNSLGTNATTAAVSPTANTTYSVTVTAANGCTVVKSIDVTVDKTAPTATITAVNPALNCTTPSTTLTAGGGTTYSWDNSLGTNATTATITPTANTTYSVTVTAANGCTSTKSIDITVDKTAPTATISAVSTALNCTTPSTTLTAGGGTIYAWDNSLGTNATTAAVSPTANTTYSVTVTAANGCTSTKSIDITVDKNAPTATISAVSSTLNCTTPSTTLTAGGGTTYSWDNSLGTNATTATITPTANTTYSVTISNANGCSTIKTIDITVDKTAPTATISAISTTLNCTTASTPLSAGGGSTYLWDNGLGTNSTTVSVSPLVNTTYSVTVTTPNGCTAVKSIDITVDKTSPTATISAVNTNLDCSTPSTTLTAGGGTIYAWDNSLGTNATTAAVSPTANTTYSVTVSSANGCTAIKKIDITVNVSPPTATAIATTPTLTCATTSTILTATGGATYLWDNTLGTNATTTAVSPTATTTYSVTVTAANGCSVIKTVIVTVDKDLPTVAINPVTPVITCTNTSVTLTASGAATYVWSNTLGTSASVSVSPTATTTYSVTATATNGCTVIQSIVVNADNSVPTATLTSDKNALDCNTPTATLTATGGTYLWDNGLGTNAVVTVTPTATTTYKVTITGANGCTTTKDYLINVDKVAPTAAISPATVAINCTTSSATLTASGGATYLWNGTLGTTPAITVSPLATTTYTVTVTAANGCTATSTRDVTVTITTPVATITPSSGSINCNSSSVGLVASGGSTYAWSNGLGTTPSVSATPTTTTTYTVTVTDANGCSATKTAVVTVDDPIGLACSQQTGVSTVGGTDGVGKVTISGGSPTYTIKFSSGGAVTTINNAVAGQNTIPSLAAGTYSVTVTDGNGCTQTCGFTIASVACNIALTLTASQQLSCFGGNNANLNLAITGASGTTTFAWNPTTVGVVQNPTNLSAGTYNVTATDNIGCAAIASIVINNPSELLINVDASTDVKCNGGTDGSVEVSVTGGTAPFQYKSDNNSYQASGIFNNFNAGAHTITAKDANGCTKTISVTVNQPNILALSVLNKINATCNGANDGQVTLSATAGTPAYTYKIDSGTGQASPSFTNISVGAHTATVTDDNGCTQTASFTITEPIALGIIINNKINPTCNTGNNGSFTASISGGTSPFQYKINSGTYQTSPNFTALSAGTFILTVKDNNDCEKTETVTLTEPLAIDLLCEQISPITAIGQSDGIGKVTITNGVAPFTIAYSLNAAAPTSVSGVSGTNTINGLAAGVYTITVTDANGCKNTCGFSINNPNCAINASITQVKAVSCANGSDGELKAEATGGASPFTYTWNPASAGTGQTATNLVAGQYNVTITDATGCNANSSFTLTNPDVLAINVSFQNVNCNGGSTKVTVAATGGKAPITGIGLFTVSQGTYTYTVTDANNCSSSTSITVTEPSAINVSLQVSTPILCNSGTGKVTVSATGGLAPYTGLGVFTASAGVVTYIVTDANGCTMSATTTVAEPTKIVLNCEQSSSTTSVGGANGIGKVNITNGVAPFKIDYSNSVTTVTIANGVTGDNLINGLKSGSYTVTVTDNNGCTETCGFGIAEVTCNMSAALTITQPIKCFGDKIAGLNLVTTNGQGILNYNWNENTLDGQQNPVGLAAGNYSVTITDDRLCIAVQSITINQPTKMTLIGAGNSLYCGATTADVFIIANGGTAPYVGATNFAQSVGTQTYTVTDANQCSATVNATITLQPDLTITCGEFLQASQFGSDGKGIIKITNGYAPYKINWKENGGTTGMQSGNNGSNIILGLAGGTYNVTVTDNFGCSKICDFIISAFQPNCNLKGTIDLVKAVNCYNGTDGEMTAVPQNGSNPYSYNWTVFNFGNQPNVKNVAPGTYKVTISDGNNCTTIQQITIPNPPEINISTVIDSIKCFGTSATVTVSAIGGTGTLTGTNTFNNVSIGVKNYTVTDSKGCKNTKTITLTQPTAININCAALNPVTTPNGTEGSASVAISGGTSSYSMTYTNGTTSKSLVGLSAGTQSLTGLTAGKYTVSVKDKNLCEDTCSFTILENVKPGCKIKLTLAVDKTINCNGSATGSIISTVTENQSTITYDWTDNTLDGIANPKDLKAGTYTLTVKDTAGCIASKTINITQPAKLVLTCAATAAVTTLNGTEGKATITIGGGVNNYTINYTNSVTTNVVNNAIKGGNNLTNLSAGTYTVIITDKNGCQDTCSFTVNTNIPGCTLTSSLVATKQLACNGDKNGEIKLTTIGGKAPFTYKWNPAAIVGPIVPNLGAGTYSVTITDAAGCISNGSVTLKEPAALTMTLTSSAVLCFGDSSSVKITAVGGTLPLTGTGTFKQGNGVKTFTVSDANGCKTTSSNTVTQPTKLTLACAQTSASNYQKTDGVGSVTITGATGPYDIIYTLGATSKVITNALATTPNVINNLAKGTYKIVVKDKNGCQDTCSFFIDENKCNLKVALKINKIINCNNDKTAELQAVVTGGQTPITYNWSNAAGNVDIIKNLGFGTYKVTLTDGFGCVDTAKVTLTNPSISPVLVINKIDTITCKTTSIKLLGVDTTKYIKVQITWKDANNANFQNGSSTTVAGTYTCTAVDTVRGCKATKSVTFYQNTIIPVANAGSDLVLNSCIKDTVLLVGVLGNTNVNPKWTTTNGFIIGAPSNTTIKTNKAGVYTFTVQHPTSFCLGKDDMNVTAKESPLASDAGADQQICGDSVVLTANNVNGIWTVKNGATSTQIITANNYKTIVKNLGLGDSKFIWTSILGTCKTEDEVRVKSVQAKAFAAIADSYTVQQVFGVFKGSVIINDKYSGPITTKLMDKPAQGTLTMGTKGMFEYTAPSDQYIGTNIFSYILCSETCPDYCSEGFGTIEVLPANTTVSDTIPFVNVFSPNGDGINDLFVIPGIENLDFVEMTVVNRWGDIVFEASPYRNNWDGRWKHGLLPEGTYYYIMRTGQEYTKRKVYKGTVTIIK